jgi:hypothetical protein
MSDELDDELDKDGPVAFLALVATSSAAGFSLSLVDDGTEDSTLVSDPWRA